MIIANNTASEGGGIYISHHTNLTLHSHSTLQILENKVTESGGGIYLSESSSINFPFKSIDDSDQTSNSFNKNQASKGGGLYLEFNSTVCTLKCLNNVINFDENSAEYGGAVYVVGKLDTSANYPECFFQPLRIPHLVPAYNMITNNTKKGGKQNEFPFQFSLNSANYSGLSLFLTVALYMEGNFKKLQSSKLLAMFKPLISVLHWYKYATVRMIVLTVLNRFHLLLSTVDTNSP